jgi:hypothetical protein
VMNACYHGFLRSPVVAQQSDLRSSG